MGAVALQQPPPRVSELPALLHGQLGQPHTEQLRRPGLRRRPVVDDAAPPAAHVVDLGLGREHRDRLLEHEDLRVLQSGGVRTDAGGHRDRRGVPGHEVLHLLLPRAGRLLRGVRGQQGHQVVRRGLQRSGVPHVPGVPGAGQRRGPPVHAQRAVRAALRQTQHHRHDLREGAELRSLGQRPGRLVQRGARAPRGSVLQRDDRCHFGCRGRPARGLHFHADRHQRGGHREGDRDDQVPQGRLRGAAALPRHGARNLDARLLPAVLQRLREGDVHRRRLPGARPDPLPVPHVLALQLRRHLARGGVRQDHLAHEPSR